MQQGLTIEELAQRCGDFFKKLSEYCYNYPKMAATMPKSYQPLEPQEKQEKPKKRAREKVIRPIKKAVDPNLPKKPLTAYISYFQQHKQRFELIYPDLNLSDITKLIAKQWKERSEQQKKPYLDKADNDRKRYDDQLGLYEQKKRSKNQKEQPAKPKKSMTSQEQENSSDEENIEQ